MIGAGPEQFAQPGMQETDMNSTHTRQAQQAQQARQEPCAHHRAAERSPCVTRAEPPPQLFGSSGLVGDDVYDHHGVQLGDIREIVLDMRSGRIGYAVLAFGGFLGIGERLLAVPWDALRLDAENRYLVLDVNREVLEDAPPFDRGDWSRLTDEFWHLAVAKLEQCGGQAPGAGRRDRA